MKEIEARQLLEEIRDLCKRHGLWVTVEEEHRPELKMIRVKEISIKVEKT
jgi:hypothetical protein